MTEAGYRIFAMCCPVDEGDEGEQLAVGAPQPATIPRQVAQTLAESAGRIGFWSGDVFVPPSAVRRVALINVEPELPTLFDQLDEAQPAEAEAVPADAAAPLDAEPTNEAPEEISLEQP